MYYRLPNKEILRGFQMNNINFIQNAIMQLEGGAFQKLFDAYLYKNINLITFKLWEYKPALIKRQRVHLTPMF